MKVGQGATVEMKGSPFFGEQGTIAELPDAEGSVVLKLAHVAKIEGVGMDPVPFHVKVPADHLALGPEPEDPAPVEEGRIGVTDPGPREGEEAGEGGGEPTGEEA
jgi:hypothetical protein